MKWALPVPMHLDPNDHSAEADEIRVRLFTQFFQRSRGKGFRSEPFHSAKRLHPRRGRAREFTRMAALQINAKYGERHEHSNGRC